MKLSIYKNMERNKSYALISKIVCSFASCLYLLFKCICVHMSFLQEADLAMAPLTVTAVREMAVDLTKPFMQTGISFVMRKDTGSEDSQYLSFLNLFSSEMWISLIVAYLLTSLCIFLVAR